MSDRCEHTNGAHPTFMSCEMAATYATNLGEKKMGCRHGVTDDRCFECEEREALWQTQYYRAAGEAAAETIDALMAGPLLAVDIETATAQAFNDAYQKIKRNRLATDPALDEISTPIYPHEIAKIIGDYARTFHRPMQEGEDLIAWWARVQAGFDRMQGSAARDVLPFRAMMRKLIAVAAQVDLDELDDLIRKANAPAPPKAYHCQICGAATNAPHYSGCPRAGQQPKKVIPPQFMQCCGNLPSSGHHSSCPTLVKPAPGIPATATMPPAVNPGYTKTPNFAPPGHTCNPTNPMIDLTCAPCSGALSRAANRLKRASITGTAVTQISKASPQDSLLNPPVKGFVGSDKYGYDPDVD